MKPLWLLVALLLTACGKEPLYQEEGFVFGTRVEVSIYGADEAQAGQAAASVMQEFQRLHNMLHAWQPSELHALNLALAQGKSFKASAELGSMLQDAAQLSAASNHLFNPAIGGLVRLWGFHADEYRAALPDAGKVAALVKAQPRMSDLTFLPSPRRGEGLGERARGEVIISSRNKNVQLDLGGYAKGYALDRAVSLLKQQGIHHALINIGGNIIALGTHGKRAWRVGIQHPRKPGPLATLDLHDGEAIGTSGDYQRYFEIDGKRYCHLLDPRNGRPAQGMQMATVLTRGAHAGVLSDAASKPLFIGGVAGWHSASGSMQVADVLLLDAHGRAQLSASLQKRLEFTDQKLQLTPL